MDVLRNISLVLVSLTLCVSCGGAQSTHSSNTSGTATPGSPTSEAGEQPPQLPSCDDGTCFRCGEGICPAGFYCESNGGVTGCQWSPACAKTPSCACLKPAMNADPRCSCEERDGAAFVTCSK